MGAVFSSCDHHLVLLLGLTYVVGDDGAHTTARAVYRAVENEGTPGEQVCMATVCGARTGVCRELEIAGDHRCSSLSDLSIFFSFFFPEMSVSWTWTAIDTELFVPFRGRSLLFPMNCSEYLYLFEFCNCFVPFLTFFRPLVVGNNG